MRLFYTAFIFLFAAPILFSQEIDIRPVQSNNVLRSYAAKKQLELESRLERLTGMNPHHMDGERGGDCPDDFPPNVFVVESGNSIEIEIDTFGLAVDSMPPVITMLSDPPLLFGNAEYISSIITVKYQANPGLAGIAADTVLLRYTQGGSVDTILKIAVDIKRKGRTIVADGVTLDPEEEISYCLDDEIDFPKPRCSYEFVNCFDGYEGEGHQVQYFFKDTCIVYIASRFPGTDTVCIEICDELLICDIFKIPVTVRGDTLSISNGAVFFEDFSTSNGPYPSPERWLDDDVYINTTFAKDPPSVGMATFDGLDRGGDPYNLVNGGIGDKLTSKPIDLSSLSPDSNIYIRYFVAPKGYGPEPEEDPFFLEFRNSQGQWIGMDTIEGTGGLAPFVVPPFVFYALKIDDPTFFHEAFQFRFKANNSPGGLGDWWHLDYIHLASGSTDVNRFPDMAFRELPSSVLRNYTSMPWSHFVDNEEQELDSVFASSLFNHENFTQELEDSQIEISETTTPKVFATTFSLSSNTINVDPNSGVNAQYTLNDAQQDGLVSFFESINPSSFRNGKTSYSFDVGVQGNEFYINDTVELATPFNDYFAHDDGSAEFQIAWKDPEGGEEMAVRYKANIDDSLTGIRIMFPHFTFYDVGGQFFNLKVWFGGENGPTENADPVYEMELVKPFFVDEKFDTLEAFTTYRLEDVFGIETPLAISKGQHFYVGLEQLTTGPPFGIPVGYDVNNPCGCNFIKDKDTNWGKIGIQPQGALMIRPVFGPVTNSSNPTSEITASENWLTIYPNPAIDELNIHLESEEHTNFQYAILNQLGQLVQLGDLQPTISLHQLTGGAYYLQTMKKSTGEIWIEKFILSKK